MSEKTLDPMIKEVARRMRAAKTPDDFYGQKKFYMLELVSRIETDLDGAGTARGCLDSFLAQDKNWQDLCREVNNDVAILSPSEFRDTVRNYDQSLAKMLGW